MPTSNPTEILLLHDQWATQQLLAACASLTQEQLHQRFEMGRGSLHDTLVHMLAAMRGWGDLLTGHPNRPRIDADNTPRSVEEISKLAEEIAAEFASAARSRPLDEIVSRERDGKTYSFTRGAVLTHVTTHDMHHRAQCLNMLRHVGAPLPRSSVMEWTFTGDVGA